MAAKYDALLAEVRPAKIGTEEKYASTRQRFGDLLRKPRRTAAENKLMDLLGVLIEDYDRRHELPEEDAKPDELLRFLLEHSGKTAADLISVFGQRSHVNEALNGKRPISAAQARKLGEVFHVKAGRFI